MKIINKLKSAGTTQGDWNEEHGIRATVHDEPRPGVIRRLTIGDAGVVMHFGKYKAGITRAAIIELFEQIEPGLKCPAPPKITGDDLTAAEIKTLTT